MVKVADNELLPLWKSVNNCMDNSKNDTFTFFYLQKTNILELKNAVVISSRKLNDSEYIIMSYKNLKEDNFSHIIYSLVIINIEPTLPIEKSRIIKYCTISEDIFDLVNTILNHKVNQMLNLLNRAIDEKFTHLMNNNFNILRYRLGKSEIQNILVKPERSGFDVPSLSSIMSQYTHEHNETTQEYIPEPIIEKKNPIIQTDKLYENLTIIKEDDLFKITYHTEEEEPYKPEELISEKKIVIPEKKVVQEKEFIVSDISETIKPTKLEEILDSISTNIRPKRERTKVLLKDI
jgi:hypothetical protein